MFILYICAIIEDSVSQNIVLSKMLLLLLLLLLLSIRI